MNHLELPLTNLDRFFFYFFLPALAVAFLAGQRFYYRRRSAKAPVFVLSKDLLFGNIVGVFGFLLMIVFLFFYILEIDFWGSLKWEWLSLLSFVFLSFLVGLGAGAHITSLTMEKLLPANSKKNNELEKALNFFHNPFSHNLGFSAGLLMFYALTLLDIFRGRSLALGGVLLWLTLVTGGVLGAAAAVLFIITRSHRLLFRQVTVLLISVWIVTLSEERTLFEHPVALLFTTMLAALAVGILVYRQTRLNLRPLAKKLVRRWLHWDIDQL